MFIKKCLFVPTVLIFTSFLGVSTANAQRQPACYTLASLQGTYAIVGNYGSNVAMAMGVEYLDGSGNMTRRTIVNEDAR